jgi:hypothetical protein
VQTLGTWIEARPLEPRDAIGWLVRMGRGLSRMHDLEASHGRIHADALLCSAPACNARGVLLDADQLSRNFLYYSAARARKGGASLEDDVWGLGVLLYYALTGAYPFPGDDRRAVRERIEWRPASPLSVYDVSHQGLQLLLERIFDPDPGKRVTRLRSVIDALVALHPAAAQLPALEFGVPSGDNVLLTVSSWRQARQKKEAPASGRAPRTRPAGGGSAEARPRGQPAQQGARSAERPLAPSLLEPGREAQPPPPPSADSPRAGEPLVEPPPESGTVRVRRINVMASRDRDELLEELASAREWTRDGAPRHSMTRRVRGGLRTWLLIAGGGVALFAGGLVAARFLGPRWVAAPPAVASGPASAPSSAAPPTTATASVSAPRRVPSPHPAAVSACAANLFDSGTFEMGEPRFDFLCSEHDPRRAADAMKTEVILGKGARPLTPAMQLWATLGWYELAYVAAARTLCCGETEGFLIAPGTESCGFEAALEALGEAAVHGDDKRFQEAMGQYHRAAHCTGYEGARRYGQLEPPSEAEANAFARAMKALRARLQPR